MEEQFTATIPDGSYEGNQKIEGIAIEVDGFEFRPHITHILLYNATKKGDWGYENTSHEMARLGVGNNHGYSHHSVGVPFALIGIGCSIMLIKLICEMIKELF